MSSVRIVHLCQGNEFLEQVESLSGPKRVVYRQNDRVLFFHPQEKLVLEKPNDGAGAFPDILSGRHVQDVAAFYRMRVLGQDRVAGLEADVIAIHPRDGWRFGHRIWSERQTGLLLKFQTLAPDARVLEQVAFSELDLQPRASTEGLRKAMPDLSGYRVQRTSRVQTDLAAEGWRLRSVVPGFVLQGCFRQNAPHHPAVLQCAFSDGLATASLFFKIPQGGVLHKSAPTGYLKGATHTYSQYIPDGAASWLIIGVGEVPVATLQALVNAAERVQ